MSDDRAKQHAVELLVKLMLEMLTPEMLKELAKTLLCFAQDVANKTENKYDDVIIGGTCAKLKSIFGITD